MNEIHIGYLIKSINDKIKVKADADLKSHRLTLSQSRVLAFLNDRGGEAAQKDIEAELDVSHPTVVGLVSRMEKNGFLSVRKDTKDKRSKIVRLTDMAAAVGRNMDSVIGRQETKMFESLSAVQIHELERSLLTILKNLEGGNNGCFDKDSSAGTKEHRG